MNKRSWGAARRWVTQVGAIKSGTLIRFGTKKQSTEKPFFVRFSRETGRAQKVATTQAVMVKKPGMRQRNQSHGVGWKAGAEGVESSGSLSQANVSPCCVVPGRTHNLNLILVKPVPDTRWPWTANHRHERPRPHCFLFTVHPSI